jgi:hypothetical protein
MRAKPMVTLRKVGSLKRNLFVCMAIILGTASAPAAAQNGHDAELRQCVADALHRRSILGSRDTVGYILYRSKLDLMGVTESEVMVGHCQEEIYRRHANQPPQQPRTRTAKRRR